MISWIAIFLLTVLVKCEDDELIRIPLETIRVPISHSPVFKVPGIENHENFYQHPLDNFFDMIYVGQVRIGRKIFRALFDSGSNDVWFVSNTCTSKFCKGRMAYDLHDRSMDDLNSITLSYGAGKANGYIVDDHIQMGNLVSKNQHFVAARSVTISKHYHFDGIVGMGPMNVGYWVKHSSFVKNLFRQGELRRALFSFVLHEHSQNRQSYMILGGIDRSLYQNDLIWVPNISNYYWTVQLTHVGFGHTYGATKGRAVIDSGTSFMLVPRPVLAGIYQVTRAVQADGNFYSVDCNLIDALPTITLKLGKGIKLPLYPRDYIDRHEGHCYLNFLPMDKDDSGNSEDPDWMLGASFLRAYYVVFDMETNHIGLARYKHR